MTKKMTRIVVLMMVLALVFAGCSKPAEETAAPEETAPVAEKITISYSTWASDGEAAYEGMEKFKEIVETESDGNITVNLFPANQLGKTEEQLEQLALNTIQLMSSGNPGIKELEYLALPYLMDSMDEWTTVLNSKIGQKWNEQLLEAKGIVNIGVLPRSPRIVSVNEEINTPADFAGLKLRVPERDYYVETFKAFGANPTPMDFGEVYSALQTGVVDGQENPIETIYAAGFHEIQDYLIITNHINKPAFVSMNADFFNGLSEEHQDIILNAAEEGRLYARELMLKQMDELEEKMVESGMEVIRPDLEPFKEATQSVRDELGTQVWGEEVYNQIKEIGSN